MHSVLFQRDKTPNVDRQFGADPYYYNATFFFDDGRSQVLRFTEEQIQEALDRGSHDSDGAKPRKDYVPKWVRRLQERFS